MKLLTVEIGQYLNLYDLPVSSPVIVGDTSTDFMKMV